MLRRFGGTRVLGAALLLGLALSFPGAAARNAAEVSNRRVDLVMDYDELLEFSGRQGYPLQRLLAELERAGLTSVAVSELNLKRLKNSGLATVVPGNELSGIAAAVDRAERNPLLEDLVRGGDIQPLHTYVLLRDRWLFERVRDGAERRLPAGSVRSWEGAGTYLVDVALSGDPAEGLGLGLGSDDLRPVLDAGLGVIPRFHNLPGVRADDVRAAFAGLRGARVDSVIFWGDQVLGYPDHLRTTARELDSSGLVLGMIESPGLLGYMNQKGNLELARLVGYRVARVYPLPEKEARTGFPTYETTARWVRSAQERNIRIMYMRPFEPEGRRGLAAVNLDHVRATKAGLEAAGFSIGPPEPFSPVRIDLPWAWGAVLGTLAGAALLLHAAIAYRPAWDWLVVGVPAAVWPIAFLRFPGPAGKMAALLAAVTFPGLAVVWAMGRGFAGPPPRGGFRAALGRGLWSMIGATALALSGALFVGTLLGGVRYLLEVDYFRGVKLTYVLPLLSVAVVFLRLREAEDRREGVRRGVFGRISDFLARPMSLKYALWLAVLGALGFLYIGRSGEAGLPVTGVETRLRLALEAYMAVRPRLKEFLIGQPALILMGAAYARRHRPYLLLASLAGVVGQISVINSFEHLRTPLALSLERTANGVVLGGAIGAAALAAVFVLGAAWERYRRGAGSGA